MTCNKGPGLSRDALMLKIAERVLQSIKLLGLRVILDADALYMVQNNPTCIKGYTNAVLTPNAGEYNRLVQAMVNLFCFVFFFVLYCFVLYFYG
jgi:ATP-dependent NAD(P)H-hydrate dehydratase